MHNGKLDLSVWQGNGERLQAIFDAAPALVWVVDAQGHFLFVNRAWERAFGLSQDEVAGRSVYEVFPKPVARVMLEQNRALFASGTPMEVELKIGAGPQAQTFLTTKAALVEHESGRPLAVCGLSVDFTGRKRDERRLRLLSNVATAVVRHGEDPETYLAHVRAQCSAELDAEVTVRRGAPEPAGGAETLIPIRSGSEHHGVLVVGLGELAPPERELLSTVADLVAVALERSARARELVEVDRRRREFLAVLAHELRAPLAPLTAALGLARKEGGVARLPAEAMEVMERQVGNLSRLVEDLVDGARVSHGKIILDAQPVALAKVVGDAVEVCQAEIERRGQALAVTMPSAPVVVSGDRRRLGQILGNLLANSARYTPRGGSITLDVRIESGSAVICVRDDGIGIEAAELPRLFRMFEQGARGRDAAGFGIGLPLAKALVELHGGSLEARSAGPGKGSEFTVRLPTLS